MAAGSAAGVTVFDLERIEALDEALSLEGEAREAFLAGLDAVTAAAVRRLLSHDEAAQRLWPTQPPSAGAGGSPGPPARIGPYRLTQLLGLGGMGTVWKGERDDGLFEQTVAVKLMRPGLVSPGAAAQFAVERRVLAKLQHPHIAQLFDGGSDPEGRAYFVMELVEGAPLTQYAQAHDLSAREAARLLLPVCAAVQHAHRALVVHADIKPGNILVDAEGRPKLLDFGIARNLQDLTEQTLGAGFTVAYASPERRAGERSRPPDDIYALGVVLYELATGLPAPEGPPPRASQAARAAEEPGVRRRARQIDAELDAVIARATAADPDARYESVGALAEDLRRWIERRPVLARPASVRRTARKFLERRPLFVAAGTAAVALLVGALAVISVLYVQDKRARAMAEQRFDDVRGMARYLLFDVYDQLARTPRALPVRRDVAAVGQAYLDRLAADGAAPADVRVEAAEGLLRLATLQGGGVTRNLGMTEEASRNLEKAIAVAEGITAQDPDNRRAWRVLARAHLERAILGADKESDFKVAEARLQASRAAIDKALVFQPADPALRRLDIEWRIQLSVLRQWQGRFPESISAANKALADLDQLTPDQRASPDSAGLRARAYDALAETTFYAGDEKGAVAPYTRYLETVADLHRRHPEDPNHMRALARAHWALGTTLLSLGHGREALAHLEDGVAMASRVSAFDPDDAQARRTLRVVKFARAEALSANGRKDEAVAALSELIDERLRLFQAAPGIAEAQRDYAVGVAALADALAQAGRLPAACEKYAASLAVFEDMRRKGRLTPFDEGYSRRLARENQATVCG